jgi:hypothetical protein
LGLQKDNDNCAKARRITRVVLLVGVAVALLGLYAPQEDYYNRYILNRSKECGPVVVALEKMKGTVIHMQRVLSFCAATEGEQRCLGEAMVLRNVKENVIFLQDFHNQNCSES